MLNGFDIKTFDIKNIIRELLISLIVTVVSMLIVSRFYKSDTITKDEVTKLLEAQRQSLTVIQLRQDSTNYAIYQSQKRETQIYEKIHKIDSIQHLTINSKFEYILDRARANNQKR